MAEKVTTMVLKVDLQCSSCYKKIKKILCKFPQIRDQVYDEKQNTVTITVVCCNPEKIRDKLCCKGGKIIQSIDIKPPPKPKEPEKPKAPEKPKEPEKPKAPEKPKEPEKPKSNGKPDKPPAEKPPPTVVPAPKPPPVVEKNPEPVQGYPPFYPGGSCCWECYQGYPGGPCYHGYGRPTPPPPPPPPRQCYCGPRPCYCGCGGNRGAYGSRCDYFSEENTSGCAIM